MIRCVLILFIFLLQARAGDIIITEMVAENRTGLVDEDGEHEDWIELYNQGSNAVDLAGWYLSNDPNNLAQWPFPSTFLAPKAFLLVFASGKDRSQATLHSNFQLDNDGEFLAVVEPDGLTISHDASFPTQYPDLAYGLEQDRSFSSLVDVNTGARFLVPSDNSLSTNWTDAGFNDLTFFPGSPGLGYDGSGQFSPLIGTDLQGAMSNVNASAYIRFPFNLGDPAFDRLSLDMLYDDGYQAYLNGVAIAADNVPASLTYNATALNDNSGGLYVEDWDASETHYDIVNLSSTPAATISNNGDTFMRLVYNGAKSNKNYVHFDRTDAGAFTQVTAEFDFRILGTADGFSMLFLPTGTYGTTASGANGEAAVNPAEEPNVGGVFAMGIDIYPNIDEISLHFGSERDERNLSGTIDLNNNQWHRMHLALTVHASGGCLVDVSVTPDVRGAAGSPVVFFDDFLIADLDPYEYRVQFSARTGGQYANMDIDRLIVSRSGVDGVLKQHTVLDAEIPRLNTGANVLAIHGVNYAATNPDFLVFPTLSAEVIEAPLLSPGWYFDEATPLNPNGSGTLGPALGVSFSEPGRVIRSAEGDLMLTLTTLQTNGMIYLTTNGDVPTTNDTLYTTPIPIGQNTELRARAFATGYSPGPVHSEYFLKLHANTEPGTYSSDLPIVVVSNFGSGDVPNPGSARQPGFIAIFEPGGTANRSSLTNLPSSVSRAGFRSRGSSSLNWAKGSMSFEAWDEDNLERTITPLDFPAESDFILYGPFHFDRALMRNTFAYEISNQMGRYASRTRYIELLLDTNGGEVNYADDYWGVYILMEKIKRDRNRVDIEALSPTDHAAPEITGGYIWKDDRLGAGEQGFNAGGLSFAHVYPSEGTITTAQASYLTDTINAAQTAVDGPDFKDPDLGYAAHIDVPSWVDHWWINVLMMNVDAFALSDYWHKPRNGKLFAGPSWDFDRSAGSYDSRDDNPLTWNPGNNTRFFTYGWYFRFWQDPNWEQAVIDRWGELRQEQVTAGNIASILHGFEADISESAVRNFAKWTSKPPNGGLAGEVTILENWLNQRIGFIDGQFLTTPAYSQPGGPVSPGTSITLSAPAGQIYYTTDGSDPRAAGGGIASSALVYSVAIPLSTTTRIRARAYNAGAPEFNWSAPGDATYGINVPAAAGGFSITEIHYHPLQASAAETNAGYFFENDFEFIELQNTSTNLVDLAGVQFTNGISFNFDNSSVLSLAPGEHVLVVRNPDAFAFRYGGSLPVAGVYDGGLRDSGEWVALVDAQSNTIHNFKYLDDAPWPEAADGTGPSLQVISTRGDYSSHTNWVPSAQVGGSPGSTPPHDGDSDGIPDVFELARFSTTNLTGQGDFDLDGQSDLEEYITGTSLTDAAEHLQLDIVFSNQVPTVMFSTIRAEGAGYGGLQRRYRLERKSPLDDAVNWTPPPGWTDRTGDGSTAQYPAVEARDVFRLQTWLE